MLSKNWSQHKARYDFIVVGSGYGGAIAAARLAEADVGKPLSVCLLERGKEWRVGDFPDSPLEILKHTRGDTGLLGILPNPLGLYEVLNYEDISVVKGSGLGGTSLINANVAIIPDEEVFDLLGWPTSLNRSTLLPYYERARRVLAAKPHPNAMKLKKVQALARGAIAAGFEAFPLDITVNFTINGPNAYGAEQIRCTDCGDCVTGCNVSSKNTLYMNYLRIAASAGAEIYTQTEVKRVEKLSDGGWRVYVTHHEDARTRKEYTIESANVILAASSINTPEILLRSESYGLSLSSAVGTGFSGNADFFGVAYNGNYVTEVLGFGTKHAPRDKSRLPGPTIVAAIKYNPHKDIYERFTAEDLTFPSASLDVAASLFRVLPGEDTDVGDEFDEWFRRNRDLLASTLPLMGIHREGALNHSLMFLVMGVDDARGTMVLDRPWHDKDGRIKILWDDVGSQVAFRKMNEALLRHSKAQGATYEEDPLWGLFNLKHLITAHPLGGCPIGDDYLQGAVDEFGRVFSGDGGVHEGLYVTDGSLLPSAVGVNPFLTISALAERIVERKIEAIKGKPYPKPAKPQPALSVDSREVLKWSEPELDRLFRVAESKGIETMINKGGLTIDVGKGVITNDEYWKGFFPKRHILGDFSSLLFKSFRKKFFRDGDAYVGETSDTDGLIKARNILSEITLNERTGDLPTGKYVLLEYPDRPWTGFYDVFKVIHQNLLIGRVYLGKYPDGKRLFTFMMTREYGLDTTSLDDHKQLWEMGSVPSKNDLQGVWRMDVVTNANQAGSIAYLKFDLKPDGRLESRYHLLGLVEGLSVPSFTDKHFQLDDFTSFRDEIRKVSNDLMVGRWITDISHGIASLLPAGSLGIFHVEDGSEDSKRAGFYYILSRSGAAVLPPNRLLSPFLDTRLPDGVSLSFDERMDGYYFQGHFTKEDGRKGDRELETLIPAQGKPENGVDCRLNLRITAKDLNEFIEGGAHQASLSGEIFFEEFAGAGGVTFKVDDRNSIFNYLKVNEQTGEAELRYQLEFATDKGDRYTFLGIKYMQKDQDQVQRGLREVLFDHTTLHCHVYKHTGQEKQEIGTAFLKFRTFEDIMAAGSLVQFLLSFRVTGPKPLSPQLQLQAKLKLLAFIGRFVQLEYDPLAPDVNLFKRGARD